METGKADYLNEDNDQIFDVNGAYRYFGGLISKWLIYKECKEGRLPHAKIGSRILIRKSALLQFLKQKEQESTTQITNDERMSQKLRQLKTQ